MNQTDAKQFYAMRAEETPPNQNDATKATQPVPLKSPPWNEWLRLARQGDETAKLRFCAQAEPFIRQLCHVSYFTGYLGKEEVYACATAEMVEFMMTYKDLPADSEIPSLLKGVMRNALINSAERAKVRKRREPHPSTMDKDDETDGDECAMETFPANRKEEPEAKLLEKELDRATTEALGHLKPGEQAMIRAFFFQNKTAAAIAKELQCSRQYVEKVKKKALERLRHMLDGYGFADGAFCL